MTIRAPREVVFQYVTTPSSWPRWHVNSLAVRGAVDHSALPGEEIIEEIGIGRRRGVATWTVQERVEPSKWSMTGRLDAGGESEITYSLSDRDGVTHYQRDFEYRMPNLFLQLLDRLVLRSRLEADARLSLQRLKELLEQGIEG